ncbi:hypothetical protein ZIOFF_071255 [Zingiber officinale]|uniref:Uncharacterized protein n=1 Tax=Zingiber officinale TaxID=94328 RepID=A0A8J5C180_ZINOF|nr:hypothetical protein ZIOFF_071255 [Zingiber officinale]
MSSSQPLGQRDMASDNVGRERGEPMRCMMRGGNQLLWLLELATANAGVGEREGPRVGRRGRATSLNYSLGWRGWCGYGQPLVLTLMIFVDYVGGFLPTVNHSPWNGIALADFVMPLFLFIVGVALSLTYKLQDIKLYTFYMELDLQKPYPTRGSDLLTWEFTNLKYSRVEIDEVQFEWAECMLDYI